MISKKSRKNTSTLKRVVKLIFKQSFKKAIDTEKSKKEVQESSNQIKTRSQKKPFEDIFNSKRKKSTTFDFGRIVPDLRNPIFKNNKEDCSNISEKKVLHSDSRNNQNIIRTIPSIFTKLSEFDKKFSTEKKNFEKEKLRPMNQKVEVLPENNITQENNGIEPQTNQFLKKTKLIGKLGFQKSARKANYFYKTTSNGKTMKEGTQRKLSNSMEQYVRKIDENNQFEKDFKKEIKEMNFCHFLNEIDSKIDKNKWDKCDSSEKTVDKEWKK